MHRILIPAGKDQQVDHIDGNKLNNQKRNLRACTQAENKRNAPARKNKLRTRFKGIHWDKQNKLWEVRLMANGKPMFFGRYKSDIDAAAAYNKAAAEHHGEFARLNVLGPETKKVK